MLKKIINNFFIIILVSTYNTKSNAVTLLPYFQTNAALAFVSKYLPDNPIIVEAGAYDGEDTILMSKLWPKATIHAFEPIPEIFKWLINKTKNYNNIFRYMCALSDKDGAAKIYISEDPSNPNVPTTSSSLLKPKEHLNYHFYVFNKSILVKTITLDRWAEKNNIKHIDLLWLDIQGYELNALKNAKKLLKKIKIIFTEAEFIEAYSGQSMYSELKEWLEQNDFELIARDAEENSKKHWCCNLVFLNKKIK